MAIVSHDNGKSDNFVLLICVLSITEMYICKFNKVKDRLWECGIWFSS